MSILPSTCVEPLQPIAPIVDGALEALCARNRGSLCKPHPATVDLSESFFADAPAGVQVYNWALTAAASKRPTTDLDSVS